MGTKPQYRPRQLPTKLLQIRRALELSQSEMLRRLNANHSSSTGRISEYESGTRTPSLLILMAYARAARVPLDILIDDEVVLPNRLPSNFQFGSLQTKSMRPTLPSWPLLTRNRKRMSWKVNKFPQPRQHVLVLHHALGCRRSLIRGTG
jgi:transcriptional regulator with XRE-family HTH domain